MEDPKPRHVENGNIEMGTAEKNEKPQLEADQGTENEEKIGEVARYTPQPYKPPVPFPQRLAKAKLDKQFGRFLEVLKKLYINIPFTKALQQMPTYAKFLKDILSNKRKLEEYETMALTEECSALIQNKLHPKLKDPGSFSIPCVIGTVNFEKALCDLGASVSLMPLSVCKKLDMGELKPTTISLQLADRSVKHPIGILEDIPIKVGKLFIPANFVVLEMEEDSQIPIILGRPFLATAGALIDVKNGKLSLTVGEEKVEFDLGNYMKCFFVEDSCCRVDLLHQVIKKELPEHYFKDPLELCLVQEESENDENDEAGDYAKLLETNDHFQPMQEKTEKLKLHTLLETPKKNKAPQVELKPLPSTLRYEFLGPNSTYPVIINANLNSAESEKLLKELDCIKGS